MKAAAMRAEKLTMMTMMVLQKKKKKKKIDLKLVYVAAREEAAKKR